MVKKKENRKIVSNLNYSLELLCVNALFLSPKIKVTVKCKIFNNAKLLGIFNAVTPVKRFQT
jgi:hypothetical protein